MLSELSILYTSNILYFYMAFWVFEWNAFHFLNLGFFFF